jgi:hypothetical protein
MVGGLVSIVTGGFRMQDTGDREDDKQLACGERACPALPESRLLYPFAAIVSG